VLAGIQGSTVGPNGLVILMWLCKVAERQMLRPSFVPPAEIRQLRDLTRYRMNLVAVRGAEKNRVEKLLEDACSSSQSSRPTSSGSRVDR